MAFLDILRNAKQKKNTNKYLANPGKIEIKINTSRL